MFGSVGSGETDLRRDRGGPGRELQRAFQSIIKIWVFILRTRRMYFTYFKQEPWESEWKGLKQDWCVFGIVPCSREAKVGVARADIGILVRKLFQCSKDMMGPFSLSYAFNLGQPFGLGSQSFLEDGF